MRKLVAAAAAVLLFSCCAPSPPSGGAAEPEFAEADSIGRASDEAAFLDLHGRIMSQLEETAEEPQETIARTEAQALLAVAEELYLEGRISIAVKLLREAEELLRRIP